MNRKSIVKHGRRVAIAACGLLLGATTVLTTSCKDDDVLTGQPSWLGNSIYERLQEDGNYTTVIRLIDDLDLKEVLGHTGSRTLFVADDKAYAEWFQNNSWGVSSYDQLSTAQKNILLKNAMINNAYLIELMSNSYMEGAIVEGMTMRRETTSSVYDSVYLMKPDEMPNTRAWAYYKKEGKSIPILKDDKTAPMIHFLPAYMTFNKITDEDLSVLTNGRANSIQEAWVNGMKVVERDITCKNGYIQKVEGVIEQNPNMAEIMRQHPEMSTWSRLMDRFSAPYFSLDATREYNRIYQNKDSVFVLRYFSDASQDAEAVNRLPDNTPAVYPLKFDPGLNQYMYTSSQYKMPNDAGALIVPTNDALDAWWNNEGSDLKDEYKELDSLPEQTLARLIRNNMIPSFSDHVPSKFSSLLNDAKEVMGVTKDNVVACYMGCNGVVYLVDKVFAPAEYASVVYPATAHQSIMNVIYWAIDQLNFLPYLLSMDSQYALIMPSNEAMNFYIDPSTYWRTSRQTDEETGEVSSTEIPQVIQFRYDASKSNMSERVQASRYNTTVDADGNITIGLRAQEEVARAVVDKMLSDMVDQLIIVIPDKTMTLEKYVEQGYNYFKTKGGSMVKVVMGDNGKLAFMGGWQLEHNNRQLATTEVFQKTNGRSYQLDQQMPLTAQKSLYMTMREHPEYQGFLQLMENEYCDLLSTLMNNKYRPAGYAQGNKNMRLFDNYNYTVFIPTTAAIEQLQASKMLPNWDELEYLYDETDGYRHDSENVVDSICKAEGWYDRYSTVSHDSVQLVVKNTMTDVITNFVRYHVMDRSVAIGMPAEAGMADGNYESMKRNPDTGRFFPLNVNFDQNAMTVVDVLGNSRPVKKAEGLYNNICREYWFEGTENNARLYMSSSAVAHLIEQPLYYEVMQPWREIVRQNLASTFN